MLAFAEIKRKKFKIRIIILFTIKIPLKA